ncbi:hypothetical protein UlMin_018788 [Ulmus minor]
MSRTLELLGLSRFHPSIFEFCYCGVVSCKRRALTLENLGRSFMDLIKLMNVDFAGVMMWLFSRTESTLPWHHLADSLSWLLGLAYFDGKKIENANNLTNFWACRVPQKDESDHDALGVGHSFTSISIGLGMAVARDLLGKNNHVVAMMGDGAMTIGQAYEARNNVLLPTATVDGPTPPIGALSRALTKLQSSTKFRQLRETAKGKWFCQTHEIVSKVNTYIRGMAANLGTSLFEKLRLYYIGSVDGHNVEDLVDVLKKIKAMLAPRHILIHVITKTYAPAEAAPDKMHGVVKFEPKLGKLLKEKSSTHSYTQYFAKSLIAEVEKDDKIVAIHATMGGVNELNLFLKHFLSRCFHVGIASHHAVNFVVVLATEGLKPFCREVLIRFAIDRVGLDGTDGTTHCGTFDTTFMACLPNMVVMVPSCKSELMYMVAMATYGANRLDCNFGILGLFRICGCILYCCCSSEKLVVEGKYSGFGYSILRGLEDLQGLFSYIACREEQRLIQFFMALRDDFEGLRGSILHCSPLPYVDLVVSELLADEIRLKS